MKKVNSDVKLFTSNSSYDEPDTNPPNSPGRLGYRSIPSGGSRQSSMESDFPPDTSSRETPSLTKLNSESDVFERENSAASLRSNDSSESLEVGKGHSGARLGNSPSITSSGYHSDDLHTAVSDPYVVAVNGNNSPSRLGSSSLSNSLASSPSRCAVSTQRYDPKHYQDENNDKTSTLVSSTEFGCWIFKLT